LRFYSNSSRERLTCLKRFEYRENISALHLLVYLFFLRQASVDVRPRPESLTEITSLNPKLF